MKKWTLFLLVICVLSSLCACSNTDTAPVLPEVAPTEAKLSDSCGYVLCNGTDDSGNVYELVASQEETALGYEINVGIIKNNAWLVPMTSEFPFLGNNGLFPMEDGTALTHITSAKIVANHLYFVDCGAFAMEYATISPMRKVLVIYNCNNLCSYTYYSDEYKWIYLYADVEFESSSMESFEVESYGRISTDDNQIIMYKDVSDIYDWSSPKIYDWFVLNAETMELRKIASGTELHPECVLAEGLIFASDHCFYDLNMAKRIDLSQYDIDNESLYFRNGQCTFFAENYLGTKFKIMIDSSGQVLSEDKQ